MSENFCPAPSSSANTTQRLPHLTARFLKPEHEESSANTGYLTSDAQIKKMVKLPRRLKRINHKLCGTQACLVPLESTYSILQSCELSAVCDHADHRKLQMLCAECCQTRIYPSSGHQKVLARIM